MHRSSCLGAACIGQAKDLSRSLIEPIFEVLDSMMARTRRIEMPLFLDIHENLAEGAKLGDVMDAHTAVPSGKRL